MADLTIVFIPAIGKIYSRVFFLCIGLFNPTMLV